MFKRFSGQAALIAGVMMGVTGSASAAVTFNWATVGNAGNGPYMALGILPIGGSVGYEYRIATTEVTNAQYAQFLNTVDPLGLNALGLYDSKMADLDEVSSLDDFGGIAFVGGGAIGANYVAAQGRENKPVVYVDWYDSVRFINWMHNGQGAGDTETGAYTLLGGTPVPSNGSSIVRNPDAQYFLPTYDEWVKAAYHDASAGTAGEYFLYPNGSNDRPVSARPDNRPDGANYHYDDGNAANNFDNGYAVAGANLSGKDVFTDVGAYFDNISPYGTYDQGGNAKEWLEGIIEGAGTRGLMGASWSNNVSTLQYTGQFGGGNAATETVGHLGFRIAAPIPEPSSLAILAASGLLLRRRGRTR